MKLHCFFLLMEGKKETGAVGMKVNNMHEFVKKINNAAFVVRFL